MSKLYVIGIGYKPLDKRTKEIVLKADVILASNRLFEVFQGYNEFEAVKDKVKVINNINETIEFISATVRQAGSPESQRLSGVEAGSPESCKALDFMEQSATGKTSILLSCRAIVLLASGDPMFFGIGRRAVKEFGEDMVEILPDLSCVQVAFSRIKEPWDDAFLMSLHGGPDPEKRRKLPYEITDIPFLLQQYSKIAILTDRENNPAKIAQTLLESAAPLHHSDISLRIFVLERLGYADEKITEGLPEKIAEIKFSEPNIVIIQKTDNSD